MNKFMVRQGDVLIVDERTAQDLGLVDNNSISAGFEVKPGDDGVTVAEGEATGYHHVVTGGDVTARRMRSAVIHLIIGTAAVLRHIKEGGQKAEHDSIDLPPGRYYSFIQRQYAGHRRTELVVD